MKIYKPLLLFTAFDRHIALRGGGGWFVFSHLLIQFTKFFDTD